jgi:hypothetical protein
MKSLKLTLASATLLLALTACGSDGGGGLTNPPPPTPPAPPAPTSFSLFVADQFATTADNTDPVAADDEDFVFDEDPAVYDSLLQ